MDGKSPRRRTPEHMVKAMGSLLGFLESTMEIGEQFPDNKLPTLDTKIWIQAGRRVLFEFFEKTMSANVVIQAESALSEQIKVSSLTQEVVRRLKHTSLTLPHSRRMETLERFSQKMANSGHSNNFMKRILLSGISKFVKLVRASNLGKEEKGYKPLHQASGRSLQRFRKKMMARQEWFKEKNDPEESPRNIRHQKDGNQRKQTRDPGVPTTSVMFVPNTRRGILVNRLKEGEDELARITGFRIKYQEAGGVQLGKMFSTDLARDQPCGRNVCWPCQTSKEGETKNCKARSMKQAAFHATQ